MMKSQERLFLCLFQVVNPKKKGKKKKYLNSGTVRNYPSKLMNHPFAWYIEFMHLIWNATLYYRKTRWVPVSYYGVFDFVIEPAPVFIVSERIRNRNCPIRQHLKVIIIDTKLIVALSLTGNTAVIPGGHWSHLPGLHKRRVSQWPRFHWTHAERWGL